MQVDSVDVSERGCCCKRTWHPCITS